MTLIGQQSDDMCQLINTCISDHKQSINKHGHKTEIKGGSTELAEL